MRATFFRRAESISKRPFNLREASAALLPPIPCVYANRAYSSKLNHRHLRRLYRRILRVHRYLPVEMRSLGDDYVKAGGVVQLFLSFEGHRLTHLPHYYPRISQAQRSDQPRIHHRIFITMEGLPRPNSSGARGPTLSWKEARPHHVREGAPPAGPTLVLASRPFITSCLTFQLSEEQLGQMYELMRATKDLWKPVEPYVDKDPHR